jgi:hypothetical protein
LGINLIRNVFRDRLFIGNALEARDLRLLYDQRIAAVIDLAIEEPPAQLARDFVYCRFPLIDGGGNPEELMTTAIRTVANLVDGQLRTLVACSAGMSRSPSIAAAGLAMATGLDIDDCLKSIINAGPHDLSADFWHCVKSAYHLLEK